MLQPLRNSRLRSGATALGYRAFIQMGYATATRIKEINSEVEWERILKDADTLKKPIIAEFSAQWCPPCRMIHPVIEEQAEKHQGITFLRLDIDNSDVLPVVTEHGVSAVPTFVSYQGRQKVAQFSGADKALLMQMVNEVAPQ